MTNAMSNYVAIGDDSLGIPLPIKAPGTVAIAQIQAQANRFAATYKPAISELPLVIDGIAGGKTIGALKKMTLIEEQLVGMPGVFSSRVTSPAVLAQTNTATGVPNVSFIRTFLTSRADAQGLAPAIFSPYLVPAGTTPPPVAAPPGTPGLPEPGLSTTTIMIGAVALGVLWALGTKRAGKGRRSR